MDDELCQFGRASVRVASVPEEQLGQMAELGHGKVGGERGLLPFLTDDTDACISSTSGSRGRERERWV